MEEINVLTIQKALQILNSRLFRSSLRSKCLRIQKVVPNFDLTMARGHGNNQCKSRSVSLSQFYNLSLFLTKTQKLVESKCKGMDRLFGTNLVLLWASVASFRTCLLKVGKVTQKLIVLACGSGINASRHR